MGGCCSSNQHSESHNKNRRASSSSASTHPPSNFSSVLAPPPVDPRNRKRKTTTTTTTTTPQLLVLPMNHPSTGARQNQQQQHVERQTVGFSVPPGEEGSGPRVVPPPSAPAPSNASSHSVTNENQQPTRTRKTATKTGERRKAPHHQPEPSAPSAFEHMHGTLMHKFPFVDTYVVESIVRCVLEGRYTLPQAEGFLRDMDVHAEVQIAVLEADLKDRTHRMELLAQVSEQDVKAHQHAIVSSTLRNNRPNPQQRLFVEGSTGHTPEGEALTRAITSSSAGEVHTSAMTSSPAAALAEIEAAGVRQGELILFLTSMTSSRQVRDHCRLMQNLLYILRMKYQTCDVGDNTFLQRRLAALVQRNNCKRKEEAQGSLSRDNAIPRDSAQNSGDDGPRGSQSLLKSPAGVPLPLLFVGMQLVGNYEEVQELVDREIFLKTLEGLGFKYEPLPLPPPVHLRSVARGESESSEEDE